MYHNHYAGASSSHHRRMNHSPESDRETSDASRGGFPRFSPRRSKSAQMLYGSSDELHDHSSSTNTSTASPACVSQFPDDQDVGRSRKSRNAIPPPRSSGHSSSPRRKAERESRRSRKSDKSSSSSKRSSSKKRSDLRVSGGSSMSGSSHHHKSSSSSARRAEREKQRQWEETQARMRARKEQERAEREAQRVHQERLERARELAMIEQERREAEQAERERQQQLLYQQQLEELAQQQQEQQYHHTGPHHRHHSLTPSGSYHEDHHHPHQAPYHHHGQHHNHHIQDMDYTMEPAVKSRHVSFALGPDGAVGRSVHFFVNENCAEMWWDEDELVHTLRQCMRTVASMRASGKDYVRGLTRLYHSYKKSVTEAQTSKSLQVVANSPQARGLELHVAQKLRAVTTKQRRQVLEMQERLRNPHLGGTTEVDDQTAMILRKEAMKHSRPCRQFAFMIAQYDTHEALKASLSSWQDDEDQ